MKASGAKEHLLPVTLIALSAALFTLPVLVHGFWPFSWDARLHTNWFYHFCQQFWNGELYPRWLSGMNEGLGSPVFFYYPPLPYWITSLLRPLIPDDPAGWRGLGVSCYLALTISGLGCYFWIRQLTPRMPALVTAILFMFMPYHLRTDLYVRGAFAEFWSFAWLPWILFFIERVAKGGAWPPLGIALSYAALVTTHLPTTLIFSLVPVSYAVLLAKRSANLKVLKVTVPGMALGIGLASIYLIPAMTMQRHATMEVMTRDLYYANSFFFSDSGFQTWNFHDDFKLQMLLLTLATMATALAAAFIANKDRTLRWQVCFWAAVLVISFFMMLPASNVIWKVIPTVQMIQFPWRFNTVLCVAAAPLIALGVMSLKRPLSTRSFIFAQAGYASVIASLYLTIVPVWKDHLVPRHDASLAVPNTIDAPEYKPRDVTIDRSDVIQKAGRIGRGQELLLSGSKDGQVTYAAPRVIRLKPDTHTNGLPFVIRQFYYFGWAALIDGKPSAVNASKPDGLIEITLPAGARELTLTLLPQAPERVGKAISAMSLLVAGLLAICIALQNHVRSRKNKELVPKEVPSEAESGR